MPASACTDLRFACTAAPAVLEVRRLSDASMRPAGSPKALAAAGDILLRNDLVTAVIDDIGSPHALAPTGGALIDLFPNDAGSSSTTGDQLNHIYQAAGILPHDAARYRTIDLVDQSPALVAAVARGTLDLRPEMSIVTRYELRACESGIRVRTEIYHGGRDALTVFPADALFWGDRGVTPFTPGQGQGFTHPDIDLASIGDAFRDVPFLAGDAHAPPFAAYAVVPCDRTSLSGFHGGTLSAAGAPRTLLLPGDSIAFERFIVVAPGPGQQGATNLALEARSQLFGEHHILVTGRTVDDSGSGAPVGGDERAASLLFYEAAAGDRPNDPARRTPWAEAVPAVDGRFAVRLPEGRALRAEIHVLGRPVGEIPTFTAAAPATDLGDVPVPATGSLDVRVVSELGEPLIAEVVLAPRDRSVVAAAAVHGTVFGQYDERKCAPYLGPPHGASPACNRVLLGPDGHASFRVPAGEYYAYATHGPFWTLARSPVDVRPGVASEISLTIAPLDLLPAGVLSADFHVHGAGSFDSSLPDRDRALSFVATGIDVIASTDHDVVTDYARVLADLGIDGRVRVMPGVETTGQILFLRPPGSDIPKVIGHYNFWPLSFDTNRARNGAPADERLEPGSLMDALEPLMVGRGVMQLNHPYSDSTLGRDTGYLKPPTHTPPLWRRSRNLDGLASQVVARSRGRREFSCPLRR